MTSKIALALTEPVNSWCGTDPEQIVALETQPVNAMDISAAGLRKPEVIGWPVGLVPKNALVSRDLANFLVSYTEVAGWGNAERRVFLP